MVKLRLLRSWQDFAATTFLAAAIPITFWFEIFVVIPEVFPWGSFLNSLHFLVGIFLLYNIVGNWLAVMLTDTSLRGEIIQPPQDPEEAKEKNWKLCSVCEAWAPPRSWHCKTCNVCILKRDHHCLLTSCCIGHRNHRYFMMLLVHLFVATAYSAIYNTYFIWFLHGPEFKTWLSFVQIIFPLAWLLVDTNTTQYYLVIYIIGFVGSLFVGVLLFYHTRIVLEGAIVAEHEKKIRCYDLGRKSNVENVLGEKWRLVWLSPSIKSPIRHDGVHWEKMNTAKDK
ncbi:probable palmitoyltransferase ZDHHC24 [Phlebotomus argentipes]|uniref:probable palmitoyltransferase ZDHHC24 n=1 Tax=Phlebotomus argentipes TaxID=94469 RepID=UPI0028934DD6|nr:probable palmitoyltransferase ZDHHC24 [Phlebotomus argentipes]